MLLKTFASTPCNCMANIDLAQKLAIMGEGREHNGRIWLIPPLYWERERDL
jgi:hypothetical protein